MLRNNNESTKYTNVALVQYAHPNFNDILVLIGFEYHLSRLTPNYRILSFTLFFLKQAVGTGNYYVANHEWTRIYTLNENVPLKYNFPPLISTKAIVIVSHVRTYIKLLSETG